MNVATYQRLRFQRVDIAPCLIDSTNDLGIVPESNGIFEEEGRHVCNTISLLP